MVGITAPKKPHFRLLQSNPELKVMLVQCHEVIHPFTLQQLLRFSMVHDGSMMCSGQEKIILMGSVAEVWPTG